MTTLRTLVEVRAEGRCEYCKRYQELVGETFFEIDHILPRSRGGMNVPGNLAFACRRCNLLKGNRIEAQDPQTQQRVLLFHPRQHRWPEHFQRSQDKLRIDGRTAIGRATVEQLRLNSPTEQRAREIQRDFLTEIFPFEE